MKLAIKQPYFLPYIGYWQVIKSVDLFVIYDNIQYTKKGWINRNKMLMNSSDFLFSIPIKKDSDYKDIVAREVSAMFDRKKNLSQIRTSYSKAPHFTKVYPTLESIFNYNETNLFLCIYNSIKVLCDYLGISTKLIVSSQLNIDHTVLRKQEKVLGICNFLNADTYYDSVGAQELYSKDVFLDKGIELKFLKSELFEYKQFNNDFIPWLSIIDVLMFNSVEKVNDMLDRYELI